MFPWPNCELTDFERQHVSIYPEEVRRPDGSVYVKPGVLNRVYPIQLARLDDSNARIQASLEGQLQIARRSRLFALTFSGDLASWRLLMRLSSGEAITAQENGTGDAPLVSSMVAGTYYNADAFIGEQPTGDDGQYVHQMGALQIEPNWELSPNTTLLFEGAIADGIEDENQRLLFIHAHVWEFPGMESAVDTGG